jgi:hypothetical protein
MRGKLDTERAEQRRYLDTCADEHTVGSQDGAVGQRRRAVVGDRHDLTAADNCLPRQAGECTTDTQAAAERVEDSALLVLVRSCKGDPRGDPRPIKPGEDSPGRCRR